MKQFLLLCAMTLMLDGFSFAQSKYKEDRKSHHHKKDGGMHMMARGHRDGGGHHGMSQFLSTDQQQALFDLKNQFELQKESIKLNYRSKRLTLDDQVKRAEFQVKGAETDEAAKKAVVNYYKAKLSIEQLELAEDKEILELEQKRFADMQKLINSW